MSENTKAQTKAFAKHLSASRLLVVLAVTSVGVALIGIFALANWAEVSELHHGMQHVLIFLAGIGLGGSSIALYTLKGGSRES